MLTIISDHRKDGKAERNVVVCMCVCVSMCVCVYVCMSKCGIELPGEGSLEKWSKGRRRGLVGFLKRAKCDPRIFRPDFLSLLAFNTSKKTRGDQLPLELLSLPGQCHLEL